MIPHPQLMPHLGTCNFDFRLENNRKGYCFVFYFMAICQGCVCINDDNAHIFVNREFHSFSQKIVREDKYANCVI